MPATRFSLVNQPEDARAALWRYMDLTKYLSLLDSRALFFPRADRLGDPFEGSFGKGAAPGEPITTPDGQKSYTTVPPDLTAAVRNLHRQKRTCTYISCWHANSYESAAMWRLYASSNQAVAIRTNYKALCNALPEQAKIGLVDYVDYATKSVPDTNTLWPFFFKRVSFAHERELRVVFQDIRKTTAIQFRQHEDVGISVPLELDSTIQQVVVAPSSPTWFRELVGNVTVRYGFNFSVRQSNLDEDPVL